MFTDSVLLYVIYIQENMKSNSVCVCVFFHFRNNYIFNITHFSINKKTFSGNTNCITSTVPKKYILQKHKILSLHIYIGIYSQTICTYIANSPVMFEYFPNFCINLNNFWWKFRCLLYRC